MKNMTPITVEGQPNLPFRGRKIRALNTNGKSIRQFHMARDACQFFKILPTKLNAIIDKNRILTFEGNTYTIERYT